MVYIVKYKETGRIENVYSSMEKAQARMKQIDKNGGNSKFYVVFEYVVE